MKNVITLMLVAMLFIVACENDEGTSPSGEIPQAPEFVIPTIALPTALSTNSDEHAQNVARYGLMATLLTTQYKSLLVPQEGAEASYSNKKWSYNWSDEENITYLLTIQDNGSNGYEWNLYISGVYEGIPIANVLLVNGTQAKDEQSNQLKIYDPIEGETGTYDWFVEEDGSSHFVIVAETFEQGVKFEVTLENDQSGEFKLYDLNGDADDTLSQHYMWNADGSGEWWEYADGAVSDQGTW